MTATDREIASDPARSADLKRGTGLMFIGAFIGIFAPIGGFLIGTIVPTDATLAGLDPLFVWLLPGMALGGIGVGIGVWGVLRWMKVNYNEVAKA